MPLPAIFKNVPYYLISGKYSFAGDLVVTKGVLYFFPRRDLETERIKAGSRAGGGNIAAKLATGAHGTGKADPDANEKDLWGAINNDELFRQKADAFLDSLRKERKTGNFSQSLPLPIRIAAPEIRNPKLSFMGNLSFQAQSDNQDFKVGPMAKTRLRNALWEGGFGKV